MAAKRLIQTYKAPGDWRSTPPGLGDFVRGICHLFELTQQLGLELRVDVSQTEFAELIEFDPGFFHAGEAARIAAAEEHFLDHNTLRWRIAEFMRSNATELYISTNMGEWNRPSLPEATQQFARRFYQFRPEIHAANEAELGDAPYAVLSVRAGDAFFGNKTTAIDQRVSASIFELIEQQVLPSAGTPLVITSDSFVLKRALVERYGMRMLEHASEHGGYGNAMPVTRDLDLLKNSRFNYHINAFGAWWSGFSYYTSLIFNIPTLNFARQFGNV